MKIVIPMVPPSPNELRRKYRNPHAYARLREKFKEAIFYMTPKAERDVLTSFGKYNKMIVKIVFYNSREYDPDNLAAAQKPILDSLKRLGFIRDDSAQWLMLISPRWSPAPRNQPKTEIDIAVDWKAKEREERVSSVAESLPPR
jgi:Holliday junction resolvase RusA-like endonuclease